MLMNWDHLFDKNFLFRLFYLCSKYKFAVSSTIGTHIFYSIAAGCPFFFLDYEEYTKKADDKIIKRDVSNPNTLILTKIKKLFSDRLDKPSDEQLDFVYSLLGHGNFKNPFSLREEFEFADKIDKFGFAKNPQTSQYNYRLPNLIPRKLLRKLKNKLTT